MYYLLLHIHVLRPTYKMAKGRQLSFDVNDKHATSPLD